MDSSTVHIVLDTWACTLKGTNETVCVKIITCVLTLSLYTLQIEYTCSYIHTVNSHVVDLDYYLVHSCSEWALELSVNQ